MLQYSDATEIETTWNHPFFIEGKGWVKAEELRAGDVSKTDKGTLRITKVHVDPRSEEVYNFEVAENHTYLVTDQGVVVHNAKYEATADYKAVIALMQDRTGRGLGSDELGILTSLLSEGSKLLPGNLKNIKNIDDFDDFLAVLGAGAQGLSIRNEVEATEKIPTAVLDDQIEEQRHELKEALSMLKQEETRSNATIEAEVKYWHKQHEMGAIDGETLRYQLNRAYEDFDLSLKARNNARERYETALGILNAVQPGTGYGEALREKIVQGVVADLYKDKEGIFPMNDTLRWELDEARRVREQFNNHQTLDYIQSAAEYTVPCRSLFSCGTKILGSWVMNKMQRKNLRPHVYKYYRAALRRKTFMRTRPLLNEVRSMRPNYPSNQHSQEYDIRSIIQSAD